MPEKTFTVQWPDGEEENCYSPSSTIDKFIEKGATYSLQEFLQRSSDGLNHASERVRQRYGFACSSAQDQLYRIQQKAKKFSDVENPMIKIITIS